MKKASQRCLADAAAIRYCEFSAPLSDPIGQCSGDVLLKSGDQLSHGGPGGPEETKEDQ